MKTKERTDKEANSGLIRLAYIDTLKEKKGRRPTVAELAEKTGLHPSSIKNHLKTLDFKELSIENAMWKILTDDVILAIYRSATQKLNPAAAKLWFQVVEGWSEKTESKISAKVEVQNNKPPVIIHIE